MVSYLGFIQLGEWLLGDTTQGAQNYTGRVSISSTTNVVFTSPSGTSTDFLNAVPGFLYLGIVELGRPLDDLQINNKAKIGNFACNSLLNVAIFGSNPGGRFACAIKTSVSFNGFPRTRFFCASKTTVSFSGKEKIHGAFQMNSACRVAFDSAFKEAVHFTMNSTTDVEFFVRSGQGPSCYYDTGYINPDNGIQNYVF